MGRARTLIALAAFVVALAAPFPVAAATDVERARELATSGHRDEAIQILQDRVVQDPTDSDARTMLGIVLSWEGRYDDARMQLESVLATNPLHGDALPALINVEQWSGHPDRAEALAARGLAANPDDASFLLAHARALQGMGKREEAIQECDRVLALAPDNKVARDLKERIRADAVRWKVAGLYTYDTFSTSDNTYPDGQQWHEAQFYVKRQLPWGSIIGRWSHAWRFGLNDDQFEVESYPHIRTGTYAWVDAGFSPNHVLYPRYRLGFDIYQSLPAGFEISGGYRRLGFTEPVNIYVTSLSYYLSSWMFTGRVFITPGTAGTSTSYSLAARQYFGKGGLAYYGFRYGWGGLSPDEITTINQLGVLSARTFAAEFAMPLPKGWEFDAWASYAREDWAVNPDVDHYSATIGVYYSF